MSNKFFFVALCACFTFCSSEPAKRAAENTAVSDPSTASTATTVAPENAVKTAQNKAVASSGGLMLIAGKAEVAAGETVCVDISVAECEQMISMQYSLRWDRNVLEFKELKDAKVLPFDANNFGTTRTAEGLLTALWIDNSLKGVTLPDGSVIYQICFKAKGKSGQQTSINFVETPTSFEAINVRNEDIGIKGVDGKVSIK